MSSGKSLPKILAALAIVLPLVACSPFETAPSAGPSVSPTTLIARPSASATPPGVQVGERAIFADGLAITVMRAELDVSKRSTWPHEGARYVAVIVRLENAGSTSLTIQTAQLTVRDQVGGIHEPLSTSARTERLGPSVALASGSSSTGSLLFELPVPTIAFSVLFRTVAVALAVPAAASISGKLGYPSDFIPAMAIYAFTTESGALEPVFAARTAIGSQAYTISGVAPGTYVLVTYADFDASHYLAAGYTRAAACGLQPSCTDHALVPVTVRAGETAQNVDPVDFDFLGNKGFPPLPQPP